MMNTRNHVRAASVALAAAALTLTACGSTARQTTIEADRYFDPNDRAATHAFAEEVVVVKLGTGHGHEVDLVPFTDFDAVVSASVAGQLAPGQTITVRQEGGVIDDEIRLIENEPLMKEKSTYVVVGRISDDGVLYALPGVGSQRVAGGPHGPAATAALAQWAELGRPGSAPPLRTNNGIRNISGVG